MTQEESNRFSGGNHTSCCGTVIMPLLGKAYVAGDGTSCSLRKRCRRDCCGQAGRSLAGHPAFVRTAAQPPGAPSHVRALGSSLTSATLVWAGPAEDGGSPVTHYAVQLQPASPAALADGMPPEWVVVYTVTFQAPLYCQWHPRVHVSKNGACMYHLAVAFLLEYSHKAGLCLHSCSFTSEDVAMDGRTGPQMCSSLQKTHILGG